MCIVHISLSCLLCIKYRNEYFEFDLIYCNQNKRGPYSIQTHLYINDGLLILYFCGSVAKA